MLLEDRGSRAPRRGRAPGARSRHGAACPSALSGGNACRWVAVPNPRPGLEKRRRTENEHSQIDARSPSDRPRLTALLPGPQRGRPGSPGSCYKVTTEISVTLEAPGTPQRGPKELPPPPAGHRGKAHRPNSTSRAGAGHRGGNVHLRGRPWPELRNMQPATPMAGAGGWFPGTEQAAEPTYPRVSQQTLPPAAGAADTPQQGGGSRHLPPIARRDSRHLPALTDRGPTLYV